MSQILIRNIILFQLEIYGVRTVVPQGKGWHKKTIIILRKLGDSLMKRNKWRDCSVTLLASHRISVFISKPPSCGDRWKLSRCAHLINVKSVQSVQKCKPCKMYGVCKLSTYRLNEALQFFRQNLSTSTNRKTLQIDFPSSCCYSSTMIQFCKGEEVVTSQQFHNAMVQLQN